MPAQKSCNVLVVEDEGLIAHDIASRLEALGHRIVATASTAQEAIAYAPQADLVLMDVRIDGPRDGIEAACEIRARCRVPVIFITAHADRSTIERAKLAQPFGYIVKPLGPTTLQSSIDIAVYKHAVERQLEEREAWLRTILACAPEGILAADTNGRVRLINGTAEALTGWALIEAQAQPIGDVLRLTEGEAGPPIQDLDVLAILEDAPIRLHRSAYIHSRAGDAFPVKGAVSPVRGPSGIAGIVITLQEATAELWEDSHARQSDQAEATARLAGEIATGFSRFTATIRRQAAQLTTQIGNFSCACEALDQIHHAIGDAEELTRRVAALGERRSDEPQRTSLKSVVRRLAKTLQSAGGPRIAIDVEEPTGPDRVLADVARLEQAITALVLHAVAITGPEGTISLKTGRASAGPGGTAVSQSAERRAVFAELTLTYSADEPNIEHLFAPACAEERFRLALAQSIVTEQGGFLAAKALPQGTLIRMMVPIDAVTAEVDAFGEGRTFTIVLIEPREGVRERLHNAAESAGYNLLEARDAAEAIVLCELKYSPVDLLIASPDDAAQVASELSELHSPRLILHLVDAPEQGPNELQRPFTKAALLNRIAALLESEAIETHAAAR